MENVQLLRRSAEDVKRDAKQWASLSGEIDPMTDAVESGVASGDSDEEAGTAYRSDSISSARRVIDVLRNALGGDQVTHGSKEISSMVQQLCEFEQDVSYSQDELDASVIVERRERILSIPGGPFSGARFLNRNR